MVKTKMFFLQDVRLSAPEQDRARKKMALKIKKMGFEKSGAEFLFISTEEFLKTKKLEEKARAWHNFLGKEFEQARFSVHVPWMPAEKTNLLSKKTNPKLLKKAVCFCSDFVDVVNIHVGHGVQLKELNKFSSLEQREKAREHILEQLLELSDLRSGLCIEAMPLVDEEKWGINILSCLPTDFEWFFSKTKKFGMTLDTCHTGISQEACRIALKQKGLFPGMLEEQLQEIKKFARQGEKIFLPLADRIRHLHYSDFALADKIQNAVHGAVPGKGLRTEQEMIELLKMLEKASKKELTATLEISEEDYAALKNNEKTFKLLSLHQYA